MTTEQEGEGVNEQEGERDGQEHQDEDKEGVNLGQGRHGGQENELFISVSKTRRFLPGSGYIHTGYVRQGSGSA